MRPSRTRSRSAMLRPLTMAKRPWSFALSASRSSRRPGSGPTASGVDSRDASVPSRSANNAIWARDGIDGGARAARGRAERSFSVIAVNLPDIRRHNASMAYSIPSVRPSALDDQSVSTTETFRSPTPPSVTATDSPARRTSKSTSLPATANRLMWINSTPAGRHGRLNRTSRRSASIDRPRPPAAS